MTSRLTFEINKSFLERFIPGSQSFALLNGRFDMSDHLGLKFGYAGILMVCSFLMEKTNNEIFKLIGKNIMLFLIDSWNNSNNGWPDYSLHIENVQDHYYHIMQYETNKAYFKAPKENKSFDKGDQGIFYAINQFTSKWNLSLDEIQSRQLELIHQCLAKEEHQPPAIKFEIVPSDLIFFKKITELDITRIWMRLLFPKTVECLKNLNVRLELKFPINGIPNQLEFVELITKNTDRIKDSLKDDTQIKYLESSLEIDKEIIKIKSLITNKAELRAEELYLNIAIDKIFSQSIDEFLKCTFILSIYVVPFMNCVQMDMNYTISKKNILFVVLTDSEIGIEIENWQFNFLTYFVEESSFLNAYLNFCHDEELEQSEKTKEKFLKFMKKMVFNKILRPHDMKLNV